MRSLIRRAPLPGSRRDPAPSRWEYRLGRLWLTPSVRVAVRIGAPVLLVALVLGGIFASENRRAAIVASFVSVKEQFQDRPEFRVSLISVTGAAPDLADAVRTKLGLKLPLSSFDIDVDAVRARIESLDAVASAEIAVRSGGVLAVVITERVPALVWRSPEGLVLIDAEGFRVAGLAARADRADLPLVAGESANAAAAEAMQILAAASPLAPRLRGLVRVGERRWNVVLDRDQIINLPSEAPVAALEHFLVQDGANDILARDIAAVDLRVASRPVLRLSATANARLRGIEIEAEALTAGTTGAEASATEAEAEGNL